MTADALTAAPFRVYAPDECGSDGYPFAWHDLGDGRGVKHLVRDQAVDRCQRCAHPYVKGAGEWSPCDAQCSMNDSHPFGEPFTRTRWEMNYEEGEGVEIVEARWRILTVHHLTGVKADLRWWNLTALCQRCHLFIQRKVVMDRPWPYPHTAWFEPHAAGWYALKYLGEEITREEAEARRWELLNLGRAQESIERMAL